MGQAGEPSQNGLGRHHASVLCVGVFRLRGVGFVTDSEGPGAIRKETFVSDLLAKHPKTDAVPPCIQIRVGNGRDQFVRERVIR